MGDRPGTVHLPAAGERVADDDEWVPFGPVGAEPEPLRNQRNYRITEADRIGIGSLKRSGFSHGRILEPALGLGHFIGLMPEAMHARSLITGIEIDSVTARLSKLLYPDAEIRRQPFEESKLGDGLILFITSKGTLDKIAGPIRGYVAAQADLLGAIRLPRDAFQQNANTEVTTDIVFLRKRLPREPPTGPAWSRVVEVTN